MIGLGCVGISQEIWPSSSIIAAPAGLQLGELEVIVLPVALLLRLSRARVHLGARDRASITR